MKFLELINKCLLELNYRQVNTFSELVKNDHKRIINILNIVNNEICNSENWNFLLRRVEINIPANTTIVENAIKGRILHLFIDNEKYKFQRDFEQFITGKPNERTYSICASNLLFPKFKTEKKAEIIYYTSNSVSDKEGNEKENFEKEDDETLLPMPFAEQLLVYGTCLRLKGNPSYIKFNYWMSMYKEALLNLRAKTCIDAKDAPIVQLHRN